MFSVFGLFFLLYQAIINWMKLSNLQTKLLLANPYANIEGQRIVVIPQQCNLVFVVSCVVFSPFNPPCSVTRAAN